MSVTVAYQVSANIFSAVTAVYKGSPRGSPAAILRSYDSRREPSPEFDCKIWQAGRATCAIGLAFKPIQVGQSSFHDDGVGTFNPSPEALDEAVVNEWPGREVGVFVSVGTGKRPKGSDSNQQVWYEGFMGEFAEARRRLISKIEGCEGIHEYMVREHLGKRNVNVENYYRLNVEIGVGEFGMNEWHRLGEISTGTRRYLTREDEQRMIQGISTKLAKVHKAKIRYERAAQGVPELVKSTSSNNFEFPLAVELPGDAPSSLPPTPRTPSDRESFESGRDSLYVQRNNHMSSPRTSHDRLDPNSKGPSPPPGVHPALRPTPPPPNHSNGSPYSDDSDRLVINAPTPSQYRVASGSDKIAIMSPDEHPRQPQTQHNAPPATRIEPPPLPPKTPLPDHQHTGPRRAQPTAPPYPMDDDAPPPPVNMARKPDYRPR